MSYSDKEEKDSTIPLTGSEKKYQLRECCSIGAMANYSIFVVFLAVFITCLIVVGSVGRLQANLEGYRDPVPDYSNVSNPSYHACYMFSSCKGSPVPNITHQGHCNFKPDTSSECAGSMVGFSFIALAALAFLISSLVKAVINQE